MRGNNSEIRALSAALMCLFLQAGCTGSVTVQYPDRPVQSATLSSESSEASYIEAGHYQVDLQNMDFRLPVVSRQDFLRIHGLVRDKVNGRPPKEFIDMFTRDIAGAIYNIKFETLIIGDHNSSVQTSYQRTGFVVSPDGLTLTARHGITKNGVLLPGSNLETGQFVSMTGCTGQGGVGEVVSVFPKQDIAVIQARNYKGQYVRLGNVDDMSIGDMVLVPGFQVGEDTSISGGLTEGYGRYLGGGVRLVSSADQPLLAGISMGFAAPGLYESGLSGGPIIGPDGNAYGFVTMTGYDPSDDLYHLFANRIVIGDLK